MVSYHFERGTVLKPNRLKRRSENIKHFLSYRLFGDHLKQSFEMSSSYQKPNRGSSLSAGPHRKKILIRKLQLVALPLCCLTLSVLICEAVPGELILWQVLSAM